jgi:hypothetical protein
LGIVLLKIEFATLSGSGLTFALHWTFGCANF